jgi:Raf kinase inhibitor-like YbhB/YbcL family protein
MHLCEPITPHWHEHHYAGLLWRILLLLAFLLAAPFLAGCRHSEPAMAAVASATITLSSTSLQDGRVPREFTCDGSDASPPLKWTAVPNGTRSLALTVTDLDAPDGTFTHWVLFNMPAGSGGLPQGLPKDGLLPDGSRQGRNDFGKVGYGGPCPPSGNPHRYVFTLYALDSALDVNEGSSRSQVESAMNGHVLAQGEMTASYGR